MKALLITARLRPIQSTRRRIKSPLAVTCDINISEIQAFNMSRALSKDASSLIQKEASQQAYHDIVQALCSNPTVRLEIEFLGKGHILPPGCNVLVDENYIGVSKSKLVQAFVIARKLIFTYLKDIENVDGQEIRNTTAVMLLMDAENLTAANTRKRLIQRRKNSVELQTILKQELIWVDGLLTSRLHRHTKSPTLWNHRRWLLDFCNPTKMPYDIHKDLTEIILVSAERHPRNYYAWQHIRWVMQNLYGENSPNGTLSLDDQWLISMILSWCTRHPSDTSGFSFLLFCLSRLPELIRPRDEVCSWVCEEVLGLATSFQWTHESVWVFLRTLVASGTVSADQKANFYKTIQVIAQDTKNASSTQILVKAEAWCKVNEGKY